MPSEDFNESAIYEYLKSSHTYRLYLQSQIYVSNTIFTDILYWCETYEKIRYMSRISYCARTSLLAGYVIDLRPSPNLVPSDRRVALNCTCEDHSPHSTLSRSLTSKLRLAPIYSHSNLCGTEHCEQRDLIFIL